MQMLFCVLGTAFGLLWIMCYFGGNKKYDRYISVLNSEDYTFSELFYIGFEVMSILHLNVREDTRHDKLRKQLADLYGEKNVAFYLYVTFGAQLTYILTMLPVGILMGAISGKLWAGLLIAAMGVGLAVNVPQKTAEKCKLREEEMQMQLPNALSTMALLLNAGMYPQQCWDAVAQMGDSELYREMQAVSQQVHNGDSLTNAVQRMGEHSSSSEVRKFCASFRQNMIKGDDALTQTLIRMNRESWDTKRNLAKRKGELAGQKLLLPTMLMFVGLMAMIIVPVFAKMSF